MIAPSGGWRRLSMSAKPISVKVVIRCSACQPGLGGVCPGPEQPAGRDLPEASLEILIPEPVRARSVDQSLSAIHSYWLKFFLRTGSLAGRGIAVARAVEVISQWACF